MKKTVKILSVIMLVIMAVTFLSTSVYAAAGTALDPKDLTATYSADDSGLQTKAQSIMGWIRNIAAIIAVIVIMVLGVKYMMGSVEEKAEYKKSFVPLIVGVVLVVAATTIASFIFNLAE